MLDLGQESIAVPLLDEHGYRLRRAAHDLYARSKRGPVFYVMASIVFMLTMGDFRTLPWYSWLPALAYALLGCLRYLNKVPEDGSTANHYRRWRFRQWLIIDCGCLIWTCHLFKAGTLGQPYSLTLIVALFCAVAYSSAIAHMFAMDRRAATLATSCLSLPGTLAFAALFDGGMPIAAGLGVHWGYTLLMLNRSNRDYRTQIATEYALLQAKSQTERLVATDALTNLANRREYERRFAQAWHMAARQQGQLALLVLDLDNFKQLNDTHGHAAGDACLRHFADILSRHFRRAGDLSARIGGEEFAVILPGISAGDAAILGEEFRRSLTESCCHYRDQAIKVTASIGAGAVDWANDSDPLATFARIDQACYEAKKQGRSRLVAV